MFSLTNKRARVWQDLASVDVTLLVAGLPDSALHVLHATHVLDTCRDHFFLSLQHLVRDVTSVVVHL